MGPGTSAPARRPDVPVSASPCVRTRKSLIVFACPRWRKAPTSDRGTCVRGEVPLKTGPRCPHPVFPGMFEYDIQ